MQRTSIFDLYKKIALRKIALRKIALRKIALRKIALRKNCDADQTWVST